MIFKDFIHFPKLVVYMIEPTFFLPISQKIWERLFPSMDQRARKHVNYTKQRREKGKSMTNLFWPK